MVLQNPINKIQSTAIFIVQKEFHHSLTKNLIRKRFMEDDYPLCSSKSVTETVTEFQKGKN